MLKYNDDMRLKNISDKQIIDTVKVAKNFASALKLLGLRPDGNFFTGLQKRVTKLGLDTSHFSKAPSNYKRNVPLEKLLRKGSFIKTARLKGRLVDEGYLSYACVGCGISSWKTNIQTSNKFLSLELDHINGDHFDNRLENLRFLCPNCHSMTDTHCGKNLKKVKYAGFCIVCNIALKRSTKKCITCYGLLLQPDGWPSPNDLINFLKTSTLTLVEDLLNVPEGTVKTFLIEKGVYDDYKNNAKAARVHRINKVNATLEHPTKCPSPEVLQELLWKYPITKISEMYTVSSRAVSKWAKKYNLSKPPRGYWAKQYSISGRQKGIEESV